MSVLAVAALVGAFASSAAAHGTVQGIVAGGTWYQGYSPSMQYESDPPAVIGWSIPEDLDNGYVAPDAYTDANIICHKGATNAQASASVAAGGTVELLWTDWPDSHHGPVISYLANCNGDCKTVDKTTLKFNKIDAKGLIDDTTVPGTWATDNLISNNNSWTTTIPSSIAAGNYVLRHEIIALHSAGSEDGAQNYPQCINLEITGDGTDSLSTGTLGTALYTETDPGIEVNIYQSLSSYTIPGPTMYSGASGSATSAAASAATTAVASSAAATSAASSAASTTAVAIAEASSTPVAAAITTPALSAVPNPSSAVPSSILTADVTALPSASGVSEPSAALPDGFTVEDLMEWFAYIAETMFNTDRKHARDLVARQVEAGSASGAAAPFGHAGAHTPGAGGFPGGAMPTPPSGGFPGGPMPTPASGAPAGAHTPGAAGFPSGPMPTPPSGHFPGGPMTPGAGAGGAMPTPGAQGHASFAAGGF